MRKIIKMVGLIGLVVPDIMFAKNLESFPPRSLIYACQTSLEKKKIPWACYLLRDQYPYEVNKIGEPEEAWNRKCLKVIPDSAAYELRDAQRFNRYLHDACREAIKGRLDILEYKSGDF
jgi:hypothetical protein